MALVKTLINRVTSFGTYRLEQAQSPSLHVSTP